MRFGNILTIILTVAFGLCSTLLSRSFTMQLRRRKLRGHTKLRLQLVPWWLVLFHASVCWSLCVLILARFPKMLFQRSIGSFESVVVIVNTVLL